MLHFFTDCDLQTGAHHYIEGSVRAQSHRDKTYYNDQEVHSVWPIGSKIHMISNVPAGTIIIEDTRGLHKAGIPEKLYRDLGYAVFLPPNFFKKQRSLYKIRRQPTPNLLKHNSFHSLTKQSSKQLMSSTAVITGGSRGIGRSIVQSFVDVTTVIVGSRNENSVVSITVSA